MKKSFLSITLIISCLVALIYLTDCANPGSPTGGPKDSIPPTMVKSTPINRTTNFKEKQITIYFSENIKADNFKSQVIITPREENEYEHKVVKNRVEILFEKSLQENTTYSINFREAIKDITENNIYEGGVFSFSTGNYIDSLSVKGTVYDLLKKEVLKDITVGLYPVNDTITPFNSLPIYLTKTDKNGIYSLENLKNGEYKIYAFNDKNKNLKAESNSEEYGFLSNIMKLDSSFSDIDLYIQRLDAREITVQSSRPSGLYYEVKFNKYIVDFDLTDSNLVANFADVNKTIRFYKTGYVKDSIPVSLTVKDSLDVELKKNVNISFPESKRSPDELKQNFTPASGTQTSETFMGKVQFTKPITKINYDSIYIKYDSITIENIIPENITFNKHKDIVTISKKIDTKKILTDAGTNAAKPGANSSYQLYIAKGTFISVEGDSSAIIKGSYSLKKPEDYGIVKGTISIPEDNYTIQLLNSSYGVVEEIRNHKNYEFVNIPPGEYMIRLLIDNDGNGKWNPGNIHIKKDPEDIIFYEDAEENSKAIILRANWERTNIDVIE